MALKIELEFLPPLLYICEILQFFLSVFTPINRVSTWLGSKSIQFISERSAK